MRKAVSIAWNDIKVEFSDRSTLVFFLLLPLAFTVIIGIGMKGLYGSGDSSADKRYPVAVIDMDNTPRSREVVATLASSTVIRPVEGEISKIESHFADKELLAIFTIPQGYQQLVTARQPVKLELRLANGDNRVLAIEEALKASVAQLNSAQAIANSSLETAEKIRPFPNPEKRDEYYQRSLQSAQEKLAYPPASVQKTQAPETSKTMGTSFEQSSSGQLVTWTLITMLAACEVFVNERLSGTLHRLLVTPTQKSTIILGKILGRLGLGLIQMLILIGFGALVLKVNWGRSPLALGLIVISFALSSVALGVFLGTIVKTRSQASNLTIMVSLLMAALGGAWWPLEITGKTYQTMVRILPTSWAMTGFTDVIIRGQGVAGILPEAGVLLMFALVFFSIGIFRLRFE